jgi:hypothetical protein
LIKKIAGLSALLCLATLAYAAPTMDIKVSQEPDCIKYTVRNTSLDSLDSIKTVIIPSGLEQKVANATKPKDWKVLIFANISYFWTSSDAILKGTSEEFKLYCDNKVPVVERYATVESNGSEVFNKALVKVPGYYKMCGRVRDYRGHGLPGIAVSLQDLNTGQVITRKTDKTGKYAATFNGSANLYDEVVVKLKGHFPSALSQTMEKISPLGNKNADIYFLDYNLAMKPILK